MKTRNKLVAAAAMLLISAIMLSTASYAWFTISVAPEISNIEATVAANGNLEIALDNGATPGESAVGDSGKNTTWGNLIDLETLAEAADLDLKPVLFTEASANANPFAYPVFGADGRIKETSALTAVASTDNAGFKVYKDGSGDTATVWAFQVDFWLRSNVAGTVSLTTATDRGAGEDGLGSTLDNDKVTVAFYDHTANAFKKATLTDGALTCEGLATLTANTAVKVSMFVYVDGSTATNETLGNTVGAMALNVQFTHSATLNGMPVTGDGNGRADDTTTD